MNYTRKFRQRGSGAGKSKAAKATTQTPQKALEGAVKTTLSAAAQLRSSGQQTLDLLAEKRQLESKITRLESSVSFRTKATHSSRNTLKARQDELAAAQKRLKEINDHFNKEDTKVKSATNALEAAAATIEGVGEHGAHVLGQRVEAAEAASAAANRAARNVNYSGLSNSARKRVHNADRRATRYAAKRPIAGLIKKYKKTIKQLKVIERRGLASAAGPSKELADHADYLQRLAREIHDRIGRKNFAAYAELANYSPAPGSPAASPNSPDPNSV